MWPSSFLYCLSVGGTSNFNFFCIVTDKSIISSSFFTHILLPTSVIKNICHMRNLVKCFTAAMLEQELRWECQSEVVATRASWVELPCKNQTGMMNKLVLLLLFVVPFCCCCLMLHFCCCIVVVAVWQNFSSGRVFDCYFTCKQGLHLLLAYGSNNCLFTS